MKNRKNESLIIKTLRVYVFIAFNIFGVSAIIQLVRSCLNFLNVGGF